MKGILLRTLQQLAQQIRPKKTTPASADKVAETLFV
jgi:hypothetical protein